MKKHYEVTITASARVLVISAESEEKALEYALDACSEGDMEIEEARVHRVVPEEQLQQARRHANAIAEDDQ